MNKPVLSAYRSESGQPLHGNAGSGWVPDGGSTWIIAVLVGIMIVTTTLPPDLLSGDEKRAAFEASIGSRIFKLSLLGFGAVICIWRIKLAVVLLRWVNPFFLGFLVLVPVSLLWSISKGDTIARYVSMLTMVMLCAAFTLGGWHRYRLQNMIRVVLTMLVFASIAYALAFPKLGIEQGEGTLNNAWRGITSQKNQLGQLASFATIFWLHALLFGQSKFLRILIGGGASAACVLLSRSSTSLLATVFSIGFMLLLWRAPTNLRRYMPFIVASFATILVVYAMAVLKIVPGLDIILSPITAFTGKDLTFSNRSEIWIIIKEHIQLSPWIGSGYGAYWIGPNPSSPSIVFLSRMYFYPAESHNGYIEVTNDLGFLGLLVLLGYLMYYVKQSLRLMKLDRGQGVLFLCMFFQQAILNLSGSSWLTVNSGFAFFIMTLATLSLARSLLEFQLQVYYGRPDEVVDRRSRTRLARS